MVYIAEVGGSLAFLSSTLVLLVGLDTGQYLFI